MESLPITVHCVHPGGIVTDIARSAHVRGDWGDLQAGFDRIARTTPERCAQVILRGVVRGRARIFVGLDARVIHLVQQTLGVLGLGLIRRISSQLIRRSSLPGAGGERLPAVDADADGPVSRS